MRVPTPIHLDPQRRTHWSNTESREELVRRRYRTVYRSVQIVDPVTDHPMDCRSRPSGPAHPAERRSKGPVQRAWVVETERVEGRRTKGRYKDRLAFGPVADSS